MVGAEKIDDIEEFFEIGLVLCDGEIRPCVQVLFTPDVDGSPFSLVEHSAPEFRPLLDPPEGFRGEG